MNINEIISLYNQHEHPIETFCMIVLVILVVFSILFYLIYYITSEVSEVLSAVVIGIFFVCLLASGIFNFYFHHEREIRDEIIQEKIIPYINKLPNISYKLESLEVLYHLDDGRYVVSVETKKDDFLTKSIFVANIYENSSENKITYKSLSKSIGEDLKKGSYNAKVFLKGPIPENLDIKPKESLFIPPVLDSYTVENLGVFVAFNIFILISLACVYFFGYWQYREEMEYYYDTTPPIIPFIGKWQNITPEAEPVVSSERLLFEELQEENRRLRIQIEEYREREEKNEKKSTVKEDLKRKIRA
jgi:hypothetical protein